MTTNDISHIIIHKFAEQSFKAFTTNAVAILENEADAIGVNKNNYIYEYEIKVSRSDFQAEFRNKKHKHELLKNRKASIFYNIWIKGKRTEDKKEVILIPNRYYFACEEGLIKPSDVPEYAGLIYIIDNGINVIKKAPLLHKVKANQKIFESFARILSQRIIYGCSYYTYKQNKK
jgi:hypothetical protein